MGGIILFIQILQTLSGVITQLPRRLFNYPAFTWKEKHLRQENHANKGQDSHLGGNFIYSLQRWNWNPKLRQSGIQSPLHTSSNAWTPTPGLGGAMSTLRFSWEPEHWCFPKSEFAQSFYGRISGNKRNGRETGDCVAQFSNETSWNQAAASGSKWKSPCTQCLLQTQSDVTWVTPGAGNGVFSQGSSAPLPSALCFC